MIARAVKSISGYDLLIGRARDWPIAEIVKADYRDSPLILSLPHSGVWLPDLALGHLAKDKLLLLDTDLYTDQVFGLVRAKVSSLKIEVNPYVVNCNRSKKRLDKPVIPRHFLYGQPIFNKKYTAEQAQQLISNYYDRYHALLRAMINKTRKKFGYCLVIDGHSLSRLGGPGTPDPGELRAEFTIGNNFNKSANPRLSRHLAGALARAGRRYHWTVKVNRPYAGGFIAKHYGRPINRVHVVQIEVNKSIYMQDRSIASDKLTIADFAIKKAGLRRVRAVLNNAALSLIKKSRELYA